MGFLGNIDDLALDEAKSLEGVPLELGAGRVIWVKQAGGHNRAIAWQGSAIAERMEPELEPLEARERDYRIHRAITAELIVARWEGFESATGEPVEYSPEAALELFTASPDTLAQVQEMASSTDAYRLARDKKKSRG